MSKNEDIKRLYRSRDNRILAGILGGIGEYFRVDATLLRVAFVFLFVFTGFVPFGLIYLLLWPIIPSEPQ